MREEGGGGGRRRREEEGGGGRRRRINSVLTIWSRGDSSFKWYSDIRVIHYSQIRRHDVQRVTNILERRQIIK